MCETDGKTVNGGRISGRSWRRMLIGLAVLPAVITIGVAGPYCAIYTMTLLLSYGFIALRNRFFMYQVLKEHDPDWKRGPARGGYWGHRLQDVRFDGQADRLSFGGGGLAPPFISLEQFPSGLRACRYGGYAASYGFFAGTEIFY